MPKESRRNRIKYSPKGEQEDTSASARAAPLANDAKTSGTSADEATLVANHIQNFLAMADLELLPTGERNRLRSLAIDILTDIRR